MEEPPSTNIDWKRWKREGLVIFATGASLTLSLWIKRTVERLIANNIVDKNVIDKGVGGPPAIVRPSVTDKPSWFRQDNFPSSVMEHRNGNWRPQSFVRGPGSVRVDGVDVPIHYRKSIECEGRTLYDHSDFIRPDHIAPCPLLRARTSCSSCEFYFDEGPVHWRDPLCIAAEKINNHLEDGVGLTSLRNMYEASL